ncbi:MAG: sugar phosphate isomerase/epimerase [Lentisphaerae bacterium]|nr:sugar phosphate isomerase/epimerase [Lentisphaerota bacterium]
MKIATTINEIMDYVPTPADAVRSYKGSGFKYLDYSFYYDHKGNSPFLLDDECYWQDQVKAASDAADECGFTFVQAHAPGYNPLSSMDYESCMRAMTRSVEACHLLNIPVIVMHTSFGPQHLYPMDKAKYFEYNKGFVGRMLETAEKYGVAVCIENTSSGNMGDFYFPRTPAEMNDFIEYMDHPLLGCCWDTGHAVMEGKSDQYDDLKELGGNLKAVHIHDNNMRSDQHLPPYCGKLQLDRFIEGLIAIDYKGVFTFESDGFLNNFNCNGKLKTLPLEVRRSALKLLFEIGRFALESYDIFEN